MIIIIIIVIASLFRFYGLNWDQGYHLHPDERMITMVAEKLSFSDPNPHFFAYGSLPIYLLRATGTLAGFLNPDFASYTNLNLVGRVLSVLFDLGTVVILYFLAKKLFNQTVGFLASFLYAVSVLPLQLAHFYAVDTLLTFFITLTLFLLIRYLEKPKINQSWDLCKNCHAEFISASNEIPKQVRDDLKCISPEIILIGVSFGLALATKTSAVLLIVPIILTLFFKIRPWKMNKIVEFTTSSGLLAVSALTIFFIAEPYALFDFPVFLRQTLEQQQMTKNAFTFPYTLQYVNKTPYLYELKNIFFWGLGPILASLSFIGVTAITIKTLLHLRLATQGPALRGYAIILLSYFWIYFLVTGSFAIGFMRYMLPLYPLLCLFAAFFFYRVTSYMKEHFSLFPYYLLLTTYYLLLLIWPLSFLSIYSQSNTRVQATNWINQNIPPGSTLAVEHWDDQLPLIGQEKYQIFELPLYDMETDFKWAKINQILDKTDYVIIASQRLYIPLQKLTDCENLPPGKCYTQTAKYYQCLFSGQDVILNLFQDLNRPKIPKQVRNDTKSVRFIKVAEFSIFPQLSILNYQLSINDSSADESFTVYDHPKIMIFRKHEKIL